LSDNPTRGPTDPVLQLLAETRLFKGLPVEELRQIAALARRQRLRAGQVLTQEGATASACWIVGSGTVEVRRGTDGVLVGRPGVIEAAALAGDVVSDSTASARDDLDLVMVPGEAVRALIPGDTLAARLLGLARHAGAAARPARTTTPVEVETGPEPERDAASPGATPDPDPPASGEHGPISDPPDGNAARAIGQAMQRAMLPRNAPRVAGYDIAAGTTVEERGLGSSLWDAFPLDDQRWVLAIMDVRGPGQPPALLLAMARAALRAAAPGMRDLAAILARTNGALAPVLGSGQQFVECALVAPGDAGIEWAAAGRLPAGVLGRAGTLETLVSHGPPLGMLDGFRYGTQQAAMGVGDALLVLSSGSTGLFRGAADLVVEVQERTAGEVVATVHRGLRAAGENGSNEVSVLFLRRH
jgi:hypothetical protein